MSTNFSTKILFFLAGLFLISCGKTEFVSSTNTSTPSSKDLVEKTDKDDFNIESNEEAGSGASLNGLEWFWQCETSPVKIPESLNNGARVIEGKGPHEIKSKKSETFNIHLSGFLCPPKTLARDIVIVVDVSGSTGNSGRGGGGGTDPSYNNDIDDDDFFDDAGQLTCERKKAVAALLKSWKKQENVRVGLITFSSGVVENTNDLLTVDQLKALYQGSDSLCAVRNSTDYGSALNAAGYLLAKGRVDTAKEVYFITDGEPDSFDESSDAARKLRQDAKVVTVMFGGASDRHLKNEVASKDENGQPLHTNAQNAKDLSKVLGKSAKSLPVSGTFKHRSIGSEKWTEGNLWEFTNKGVFDIPILTLDLNDYKKGIEFVYSYKDNKGNDFGSSGIINWK